jgi:hypothetical protein
MVFLRRVAGHMTLAFAGCRLSEALALSVDRVAGLLVLESLKKRSAMPVCGEGGLARVAGSRRGGLIAAPALPPGEAGECVEGSPRICVWIESASPGDLEREDHAGAPARRHHQGRPNLSMQHRCNRRPHSPIAWVLKRLSDKLDGSAASVRRSHHWLSMLL